MFFKTEIIFVRVLLPFIAGISTFYIFPHLFLYKVLFCISIVLLIGLIVINSAYLKIKAYRYKGFNGLIIYSFIYISGGLIELQNDQLIHKDHFSKQPFETLKIRIDNEPQRTNKIIRFTATAMTGYSKKDVSPVSGRILIAIQLNSTKSRTPLKYGDVLMIKGMFSKIEPPYNPGEFNFKDWLKNQNIHHQAFITSGKFIKLRANKGNLLIRSALSIREQQIATYRKLIKNDAAFAVASTLLLGYRSDLSDETLAAYATTGTIHALSVSGAHVAILYLFLNYVLFFLEKGRLLKSLKLVILCSLLWAYAMLTGFSPSVLRAVIMLTVFITAKSYSTHTNSYNTVAFSAFILLIYNPRYLFDVGFQLSYMAVIGLLYLQPKIYNFIYLRNTYLDKIWKVAALSIAAQIATFPLSIYYFHQFPVYFLLGNLFILLPVNLIMGLGVIVLIPYCWFLGPAFEWIILFINDVLKKIAGLPLSGIAGIYISKEALFLLSATLLLLILAFQHAHKRLLYIALSLFCLFQLLISYDKIRAANQKRILFFSLRKNYATAFITSNRAVLVTDLLQNDKTYSYFVSPALKKFKIDTVIRISIGDKITLPDFKADNHQIRFYGYHILILSDFFNRRTVQNFPTFSAIWLHKNPKVPLQRVRQTINAPLVIVDATNTDTEIRKYTAEAKKIGFKHQILKKNAAYLIDLK